jgi:hypothetical protein
MTYDNWQYILQFIGHLFSPQKRFFRAEKIHWYNPQANTKLTQIFIRNPPFANYSEKRKWDNFPHMFGNLEGISCRVIYSWTS